MTGLTRQLAEFVSGLAFERLPQTAVETAKRGAAARLFERLSRLEAQAAVAGLYAR